MRDWLTKVSITVEVLAAVGRFGPPQPLREVSISAPIEAGKPSSTSFLRNATAKVSSSWYGFPAAQRLSRACSSAFRYGSLRAA